MAEYEGDHIWSLSADVEATCLQRYGGTPYWESKTKIGHWKYYEGAGVFEFDRYTLYWPQPAPPAPYPYIPEWMLWAIIAVVFIILVPGGFLIYRIIRRRPKKRGRNPPET